MLVYAGRDKVYIYENGILRPSDVKIRDSIIKRDLLEGTVRLGLAKWTSSILSEMGIRASVYNFEHSRFNGILHSEVAVDVSDVDLEYIKRLQVRTSQLSMLQQKKISMSFVVIEPQGANRDDLGFESLNGVVDPQYPKRYIIFTIHSSKAE